MGQNKPTDDEGNAKMMNATTTEVTTTETTEVNLNLRMGLADLVTELWTISIWQPARFRPPGQPGPKFWNVF